MTITVKFVKAHPQFAYFAGQVGVVSIDKAAMLLKNGYALPVPEEIGGVDANTLPADFPARDILFAAGFDSIEKVVAAGDQIVEVKGIGKGTVKAINSYLEKPKE